MSPQCAYTLYPSISLQVLHSHTGLGYFLCKYAHCSQSILIQNPSMIEQCTTLPCSSTVLTSGCGSHRLSISSSVSILKIFLFFIYRLLFKLVFYNIGKAVARRSHRVQQCQESYHPHDVPDSLSDSTEPQPNPPPPIALPTDSANFVVESFCLVLVDDLLDFFGSFDIYTSMSKIDNPFQGRYTYD